MTRHSSSCVIISGHNNGIKTHCVPYNLIGEKLQLLDSFGLPPPLEREKSNKYFSFEKELSDSRHAQCSMWILLLSISQ